MGVSACEQVDPQYLNVERYELDPDALSNLIHAQVQARQQESDSIDKTTLMYVCWSFFPFIY